MQSLDNLAQPEANESLPEGGILHWDIRSGCTGHMLIGGLLELGLSSSIIEEALVRAGLNFLFLRTFQEQRGGLQGMRVLFADESGRALVQFGNSLKRNPMGHASERRHLDRSRKTQRASRLPRRQGSQTPSAEAIAAVEPVPSLQGEDAQITSIRPSIQSGFPPNKVDSDPEQKQPKLWAEDVPVSLDQMDAFLQHSNLDVLEKALSRKALLRLIAAYGSVSEGNPRDLFFPGRQALDLLCQLIGTCGLISALAPAEVTASPVGLSSAPVEADFCAADPMMWPGPSPVVLEILNQIPVLEHDLPIPCTTPTGAALVWAFAHHFGTRPAARYSTHGYGLSPYDLRDITSCCRASFASPTADDGQLQRTHLPASQWRVRALIPYHIDIEDLFRKMQDAGAQDLRSYPVQLQGRAHGCQIESTIPPDGEEALCALIFGQGQAEEIHLENIFSIKPDCRMVTVFVGRGKKKVPVRVKEKRFRGQFAGMEVMQEDLQNAWAQCDIPQDILRAEAVLEWESYNMNRAQRNGPEPTETNNE
jgi:uncharacterized protein (DUF111 family)